MGNQHQRFSEIQMQKLYSRFMHMDEDQSGDLDPKQLLKIPELKDAPLVKRVIDIFDKDKDGKISFSEFIQGLACLYGNEQKQKLKFAFKIYDVDDDGFISQQQLFQVLRQMITGQITEQQLKTLVKRTIHHADLDKDGKLNFQQFENAVKNVKVTDKLKFKLN